MGIQLIKRVLVKGRGVGVYPNKYTINRRSYKKIGIDLKVLNPNLSFLLESAYDNKQMPTKLEKWKNLKILAPCRVL